MCIRIVHVELPEPSDLVPDLPTHPSQHDASVRPWFRPSCEESLRLNQGLRKVSLPQTPSVGLAGVSESEHDCRMIAIALLFVRLLCDCFKSRRRLEAEILVLRHQLNVLHRRAPRRLYMTWADRALT
jgi:hypothetical protein